MFRTRPQEGDDDDENEDESLPTGVEDNVSDDQDPPAGLRALQRRLATADLELNETLDRNVTSRTSGNTGAPFRVATPGPRSQNAFIRAGLRQSVGTASTPKAASYKDTDDERAAEKAKQERELKFTSSGPIIDGRSLQVRTAAKPIDTFVPARQWDKEKRMQLEADIQQAFTKAATGYVLGKSNKLNTPKVSASSEDQLVTVQNLQSQLKQLKAHMVSFDIIDVMTVVVPIDVSKEPTLEQSTYDIFEDLTKLRSVHVANSNVWYNTWVTDDYVHDNMVLTLLFLQHNTDESLWARCWERYEEYTAVEQGGPLMLYLLLRAIQDSSDQALEHLTTQLKNLNISKLPGEDIEQAVLLIKSTYRVLKSSSTSTRTYVPAEFIQLVTRIFLTCSVKGFTEPIKQHMDYIQLQADLHGTQPAYPSVSELLNMALNAYHRLKASGVWDSPSGRRANLASQRAKPATAAATPPSTPSRGIRKKICWNCEREDHLVPDCPDPKDPERIEANRQKWWAARKNSRSSNNRPRHKTGADGRPMILNKKGLYVLDQKKWRAHLASRKVAVEVSSPPAQSEDKSPAPESLANTAVARLGACRDALKRHVTFVV